MIVTQHALQLRPRTRGFHLITEEVYEKLPDIRSIAVGVAHVMLLHTSAGLTLNENADPDVRTDFGTIFDKLVPEGDPDYVHTYEGSDDMPAHVKSSLTGSSLTVPVRDGAFLLGRWQGLYLCEFRNHGGLRHMVVTIFGSLAVNNDLV